MLYVPVNTSQSCRGVFLSFCVEQVLIREYSVLPMDTTHTSDFDPKSRAYPGFLESIKERDFALLILSHFS